MKDICRTCPSGDTNHCPHYDNCHYMINDAPDYIVTVKWDHNDIRMNSWGTTDFLTVLNDRIDRYGLPDHINVVSHAQFVGLDN